VQGRSCGGKIASAHPLVLHLKTYSPCVMVTMEQKKHIKTVGG
jgi:hypothetical protein